MDEWDFQGGRNKSPGRIDGDQRVGDQRLGKEHRVASMINKRFSGLHYRNRSAGNASAAVLAGSQRRAPRKAHSRALEPSEARPEEGAQPRA
ncbi:hypothetical protein NDU88_008890 [Pleurodeles waltl]|uniref:Uncharacterized protein n=1 Tax=Pleurodeles waltl TaxID=8319 RepID=A0AAV7PTG9_PLEWA|nr:hypothetical protein NDU88_008890 [Pleurodeles waltl]